MKAHRMARNAGSAAIGIDDLLAAIDLPYAANETQQAGDAMKPIPAQDIPFSAEAAAVIASLNVATATPEQLREALLAAKRP